MADLDFSAFNLTEKDLEGIDPNDLAILDKPIKPKRPPLDLPEEKELTKPGSINPDKFLFDPEEFLSGITPDKKQQKLILLTQLREIS